MARDPAALPDPELPSGDPAGSRSGAARGGWLRWVGVAGLCAVIWGGLVLAWPLWEKHRAYEIVAEHFDWNENAKAATVKREARKPGPGALGELDRKTARALRVLGTRELDVLGCSGITSVAALGDIATLQSVDLRGCTGLPSVAGLPAGLQTLYLNDCTRLTVVDALPAGLQTLFLNYCTGLTVVDALPAGLQTLYLNYCTGLTGVDALPAGLQTLFLGGCTGLTGVDALPAGLQTLNLGGCTGLERLGTLPTGLNYVYMKNTPKLPEAVKAEIRALVKNNGGEVIE